MTAARFEDDPKTAPAGKVVMVKDHLTDEGSQFIDAGDKIDFRLVRPDADAGGTTFSSSALECVTHKFFLYLLVRISEHLRANTSGSTEPDALTISVSLNFDD